MNSGVKTAESLTEELYSNKKRQDSIKRLNETNR